MRHWLDRSAMGKVIRAFVAVELPPAIIEAAENLRKRYAAAGLRPRWVKPANVHLTLKFLGDIAPDRQADARLAMQRAAQGQPTIRLSTAGTGVFPNLRKPRVLWVGLSGEVAALLELAARLDARFAELEFARDTRPFKAHLTLARMRPEEDSQRMAQAIGQLGGFAPLGFDVSELVLFQSDLRSDGAVYTPLARVAFERSRRRPEEPSAGPGAGIGQTICHQEDQ
jgi:2'-5' RNA ligase